MLWSRQKENRLLKHNKGQSSAYSRRLRIAFWSKGINRWAVYILCGLSFIGVFADFLANEKPIYCQYQGKSYWPIFKSYTVDMGWSSWNKDVSMIDWHEAEYEKAWRPIIPYSASYLDSKNAGFKKPNGNQNIRSSRFRHWLGTDQLGRDIAAGLIHGTRVSLAVGLLSMAIASIIGIFLGMIAGYYGDDQWRINRLQAILTSILVLYSTYIIFHVSQFLGWKTVIVLGVIGLLGFFVFRGAAMLNTSFLSKELKVPLDIIIMRVIEVINSFPALFTVLAIVAIINKPSILYLMMVIGLIRWTGIARFTRAEMLKVREQNYISAAKGLGLSDVTILIKHALPNVLPPVMITIAFGIAGAILLESFLSFLGIGVDPSQVTWGTLLQTARYNFSHWWLALFPGLMIFITVTIFNLIGNGLTEAMEGQ